MDGIYNSGNGAICATKGKALTTSLPESNTASTKGKSLATLGFILIDQLTTFQALFGITSYQSSTEIYIKKAEMLGLTPNSNNSAESLVVALLLLWTAYAKGKIDGKVSVDRWGVYLADSKVRYVLEANFYRQLTVTSNEIQDIDETLTPSDF